MGLLDNLDPKSWVVDLFGKGITSITEGASKIIQDFVPDPNKQTEAMLQIKSLALQGEQLVLQGENARLQDVQSAREMYAKKSTIADIFAITFLVGFIGLTAFMLWMLISFIGGQKITLPDWGVALISTIYGVVSTKVSTIVDFFFGSSKGSHDKDETVSEAFKAATAGR